MTDTPHNKQVIASDVPSSTTLGESLANELSREAKDFRDEALGKAKKVGSHIKRAAKGSAESVLDTAKTLASDTGEQIKEAAVVQKGAGVDRLMRIASVIRNAGDEIAKEVPFVATYAHLAADEIDDFADALDTQTLGEIFDTIENFARRRPAAILAIGAVAGFAAVRLLKIPVKAGVVS
jgi:vacuolar-type H+-ATPase subunit E/Vma4